MKVKIQINKPFLKHKSGDVVEVKSNDKGNPYDKFWRNRIRDSQIDNCVQVVTPPPVIVPKKVKSEDKLNANITT